MTFKKTTLKDAVQEHLDNISICEILRAGLSEAKKAKDLKEVCRIQSELLSLVNISRLMLKNGDSFNIYIHGNSPYHKNIKGLTAVSEAGAETDFVIESGKVK